MKPITITELYLDDVKISNIESKDLDRAREFMTKHFGDMDDKTEIPTTSGFTFSVKGVLSTEDAAHARFIDVPAEILNLEFYLGRKSESFGFDLPVYVENCKIGHTGGEAVEIDVSFKAAGPATKIEAGV